MEALDDSGKVWLRGQVKPVPAVRVGTAIIVPGLEAEDSLSCWVTEGSLCVDVCDAAGRVRIARRFAGELEGTAPGTLFNGFTKTKHADIRAVLPDAAGVTERRFEGAVFDEVASMERDEFWKHAGLDGNGYPEGA